MSRQEGHYRKVVEEQRDTRFARCGYSDRFDPFRLSNVSRIRALYDFVFQGLSEDGPCNRLLDAGCGTGIYFESLGPHARHIDAVDGSPEMIGVARSFCAQKGLTHIHPAVGTMEALPYPDEAFDVVTELDVLHHLEQSRRGIDEVYRVLKPGGRFLVFEPNIANPLMFFAHALPREERRALSRNHPRALLALLEARFETVRWMGVCELITETQGVKRALLDAYLGACRFLGREAWYPRQVWLGKKPGSTRHGF